MPIGSSGRAAKAAEAEAEKSAKSHTSGDGEARVTLTEPAEVKGDSESDAGSEQGATLARRPSSMTGAHRARPDNYHAQQVVQELYLRYLKQQERYRGYRNLFVFLGFMALFLAILFTQRQANAAHQVHRTLNAVLVPSNIQGHIKVMGSVNELYLWLARMLGNVWVDPLCGDGVCEGPYEYPEYSTYGCRADCDMLKSVQNLTRVRIAVDHDFSHPSGSIPSAELMQQTSWNLCPTVGSDIKYSAGCYFPQDNRFNSLSGSYSKILDDLPDGEWTLMMRRDIFKKTRGSIIDYDQVINVAYYYRVYLAAVTAMAEQETEIKILELAKKFVPVTNPTPTTYDTATSNELQAASTNTNERHNGLIEFGEVVEPFYTQFLDWAAFEVLQNPNAENTIQATREYYWNSFINATCTCWNEAADMSGNSTHTFATLAKDVEGTESKEEIPLLLQPFFLGLNPIKDKADLDARVCTSTAGYTLMESPNQWTKAEDGTWAPSGGTSADLSQGSLVAVPANETTRVCNAMHDTAMLWRKKHIDLLREILVKDRLGNQRTSGKIEARIALRNSLRKSIEANQRELFEPVFTMPTGSLIFGTNELTGHPNLPHARLENMQRQFVSGTYNVSAPASLTVSRRAIYDESPVPDITELLARADNRIAEVKEQQQQMLDIEVPRDTSLPGTENYPKIVKVHEIVKGFAGAVGYELDGPKCAQAANRKFKPCIEFDLGVAADGTSRGKVVISNNTAPASDHDNLATIGTSGGISASSLSTSSFTDGVFRSSRDGKFSTSTFNVQTGVKNLKLEPNFYDSKMAKVPVEGIRTAYTRAAWDGGKDAYLRLRLTPDDMHPDGRGPEYQGTCTAEITQDDYTVSTTDLTCLFQESNFKQPYKCTDAAGAVDPTLQMDSEDYRKRCEMPCSRIKVCNELCACKDEEGEVTCSLEKKGNYCACDACTKNKDLPVDFTASPQFKELVKDATTSAGQTVSEINMGTDGEGLVKIPDDFTRRRRLMQTDSEQLLSQINIIKDKQKQITSDMQSLTSQVDISNQLATERANDNPVLAVIAEIRQDINSGQARVESRLDEILGRQSESLEVAQRSTQALDSIRGLAQRQQEAQEALKSTVDTQLSAIESSIKSGQKIAQEVLHDFKGVKLGEVRAERRNTLANKEIIVLPYERYYVALDNGYTIDKKQPRERNVGLTNRVISGVLLHQVRTTDKKCSESKFFKIQEACQGPRDLAAYGIDPVFKRGTQLFNPDFDDLNQDAIQEYYNCKEIKNPTYNVTLDDGRLVNVQTNVGTETERNFCAELFSSQTLPYAFHHRNLTDKEPGFPVFIDINLSEDQAQTWLRYLREGLYIDQHTQKVTVQMMTYNAPLRVFGFFDVQFTFSEGGSIQVTHRLDSVRTELYCTYNEEVRYAFEIILSAWIYMMVLKNLYAMLQHQVKDGNFMKFFLSGWNWTEFSSNALLATCVSIWWYFVVVHQKNFDLELRHDVYQTLRPQANFLALENQGQNLDNLWLDYKTLQDLIATLDLYFMLGAINILVLMVRMLKMMDFQPRLGVVTRSLWLAGPDLIHFAFVFFMVFVGYAMLAHLIFGNAIENFQTFDNSVNTCFEILLGEISVNEQLRELGGLQAIAGAFFFWTYMLLVFMVLLNFLLAIIVDAFSEVKEQTQETVGIHTELYQLGREKVHSIMSLIRPNYISDTRVEAMLKKWSHGEEKKSEPDTSLKLLTVLNEDLDEADLKAVLLECLRDAPQDQDDDPKNQSFMKRLGNCLPFNSKKLKATPEQVELAAKYIVDRFGIPTIVEEDEGEEGVVGEELRSAVKRMRENAYRQELEAKIAAEGSGAIVGANPAAAPGDMLFNPDALKKVEGWNADNQVAPMDKLEAAERDQLSAALDRLGNVQRLLADSQATLIADQQRLAALVQQVNAERNAGGSNNA